MLRDELFHLMRRLVQEHTSKWQEAGIPATKPQAALLRSVAEHPGAELTTLATASATTKATLSEMVSRSEAAGLLVRTKDASDRRRQSLELTPLGAQTERRVRDLAAGVDDGFLSRLTSDERDSLVAILHKLLAPER